MEGNNREDLFQIFIKAKPQESVIFEETKLQVQKLGEKMQQIGGKAFEMRRKVRES